MLTRNEQSSLIGKASLHIAKAELSLIDTRKGGNLTEDELREVNSAIVSLREAWKNLHHLMGKGE